MNQVISRKNTARKGKSKLSAGRVIALGFIGVILAGTILLSLPISHTGEVRVTLLDALFTSVSSVCVTGLITVETGAAYSYFGQAVIMFLLQIGGLGITSISAGLVVLFGGSLSTKGNNLVKEALNYPVYSGLGGMIRSVMLMDFSIEAAGAVMAFTVFFRDYSMGKAIWLSVFHSISAFNNGGFDVLGSGDSIGAYSGDVWFNILTSLLIILGGLGFFVIRELILYMRGKVRSLSLHTKVVLMVTGVLLISGTLLLKLTEGDNISWVGAFFASVTARTAGFATYPLSGFSNAGLIVMCVLMFIGASPGSTGGGVKTTTAYVFIKRLISVATGREAISFRRRIKSDAMSKAYIIVSLGLVWVIICSIMITFFDPEFDLSEVLFEQFSAFGTAGLSTGITGLLSVPSKVILMLSMYIGRLGPLTISTLWVAGAKSHASRPDGDLPIG